MFEVADFGRTLGAEREGDAVEAGRAVVDVVNLEEPFSGGSNSSLLFKSDGGLGGEIVFAGAGFDFYEDDGTIGGVGHYEVDLAGFAGEIAAEGTKAFF